MAAWHLGRMCIFSSNWARAEEGNVNDDSGSFPWLFVLLQIQTPLPADLLCLLLWTHSQTNTHTHTQTHTYVRIGRRGCISIHWNWNSGLSYCLVWDRLERGIIWRIIAGDKLPLQKWLHWVGHSVCVRECNSDRSQHFVNGTSKYLNKTLCTGATLLGKDIKSQISSKWLIHSVSVYSCIAPHHSNKHINLTNSVSTCSIITLLIPEQHAVDHKRSLRWDNQLSEHKTRINFHSHARSRLSPSPWGHSMA